MDLRFIEREVTSLVDGITYRITRGRILQFRDGPSSPWQDVPLETEAGTVAKIGVQAKLIYFAVPIATALRVEREI